MSTSREVTLSRSRKIGRPSPFQGDRSCSSSIKVAVDEVRNRIKLFFIGVQRRRRRHGFVPQSAAARSWASGDTVRAPAVRRHQAFMSHRLHLLIIVPFSPFSSFFLLRLEGCNRPTVRHLRHFLLLPVSAMGGAACCGLCLGGVHGLLWPAHDRLDGGKGCLGGPHGRLQ